MKPWGRFVATDIYGAGGVALVARELAKQGLVHGERRPSTAARSPRSRPRSRRPPGQEVVATDRAADQAERLASRILRGNLAPEGCVVKLAGRPAPSTAGPARVFDSEEACIRRGQGAGDPAPATWS